MGCFEGFVKNEMIIEGSWSQGILGVKLYNHILRKKQLYFKSKRTYTLKVKEHIL
jgi:hypothetical protein